MDNKKVRNSIKDILIGLALIAGGRLLVSLGFGSPTGRVHIPSGTPEYSNEMVPVIGIFCSFIGLYFIIKALVPIFSSGWNLVQNWWNGKSWSSRAIHSLGRAILFVLSPLGWIMLKVLTY